ncbi:MAG TPA: aldehyde dehydrogenase family protein [Thermoanaerobaculia bacterium]|nr:aldehyde dehydrogenase family protein [Thermoanaerobaculia bacterium]
MSLPILKTYKFYVGGAFVRSESGRYDVAVDGRGEHFANVCRGSRKDVRDAVLRARAAQAKWSEATPYLRGQVLYRMAEMLEGRAEAFAQLLRRTSGSSATASKKEVRAAIDRIVHYAGWADKFGAILSTVNPVASAYFDFSLPEPTGVVGVTAPDRPALLGLISHVLPVIATGNACVVVLAERDPIPGLEWAEVLATSDLPGGVVNLISGRREELVPHLARHMDVNALSLAGLDPEVELAAMQDAAVNVKRVKAWHNLDYYAESAQGLDPMRPFLEIKTTWHPIGW